MKLENGNYSSYHLVEIFPLGIPYHGDEVRSQEAVFCQIDCRQGTPQLYHVKLHSMAYPDIQPFHIQRKLGSLRQDIKICNNNDQRQVLLNNIFSLESYHKVSSILLCCSASWKISTYRSSKP